MHVLQYTPVADVGKKYSKGSRVDVTGPLVMRIQDRPLQEMRDEGKRVHVCVRCMCGGSDGACVCPLSSLGGRQCGNH